MRFKRTEPKVRRKWRPWRIRSAAEVARARHYTDFEAINEELFEREEAAQVTLAGAEKIVTNKAMTLVRKISKQVRPLIVRVMSSQEALEQGLKRGQYVRKGDPTLTDEEKKQGFRVKAGLSFANADEKLRSMTEHISQIRTKEFLRDVANHASLELTGLIKLRLEDLKLFEKLDELENKFKTIFERKEKTEAEIFELLKGHLAGPPGSPTEAEEILTNTGHTDHPALKDAIDTIVRELVKKFADEKKWIEYLSKLRIAIKALIVDLDEAIIFARRELRAISSQSHIERVARQLGYKTREIASMEIKLLESIKDALADLKHFEDTQLVLMDKQKALIEELYKETKLDAVRAVPIRPP